MCEGKQKKSKIDKGKKKPSGVIVVNSFSKLTQFAGQAKVDYFDLRASRVHTDDVLRFEVQVYNVLTVNILHAFQDLLHVTGTGELRVFKVVVHKPLEKLPACDAEETDKASVSGQTAW